MTVNGHVENGQIVLDEAVPLVEGMKVRVEVIGTKPEGMNADEGPTLYDQLKPIVGAVKDLPPDFAKNHDHYLHGQPKR
jgi:hypothetical protein